MRLYTSLNTYHVCCYLNTIAARRLLLHNRSGSTYIRSLPYTTTFSISVRGESMSAKTTRPRGVTKSKASSTSVSTRTRTRTQTKGAAAEKEESSTAHDATMEVNPTTSEGNPFAGHESTRATETHVFFWGGILSNWWKQSPNFSGAKCMDIVLAEFDKLPEDERFPYPAHDALSTQLIRNHGFGCGEQWMMVMKAWLFERHLGLGNVKVDLSRDKSVDGVMGRTEFEELKSALMHHKAKKSWAGDSDEECFYDGALCAILRSTEPRKQKAIGKKARGFHPEVWETVGEIIVTAGCIVRAEVDDELRKLYMAAGSKKFVEGSPFDKIWGVGLRWNDHSIDNEKNWKGQNKLGKCHDAAAVAIRDRFTETTT